MKLQELKNKITFADCFEIMQQLPDKCIDLAFIDPPYGKKCDGGSYGFGLTPKQYQKKKWDEKIPDKKVFDEIFRVSKNQIIFGSNNFELPPYKGFIVWNKGIPFDFTMSMAELAYISEGLGTISKIYNCRVQGGEFRYHPTQKPLKLFESILRNYANVGGGS